MTSALELIAAVRQAAANRLHIGGVTPAAQFAGQHHATPERKAWRAVVKKLGRRQAIKMRKISCLLPTIGE